jgi:hypothetical protein
MLPHPGRQINAPATPPVIMTTHRKRIRVPGSHPQPQPPATPKLRNTSADADPVQIPLSLLFFELSDDLQGVLQLHVNDAGALALQGFPETG